MDDDARGRERAKLNAWMRDNKCHGVDSLSRPRRYCACFFSSAA